MSTQQDILHKARELLAQEYEKPIGEGPYLEYADLARCGNGSFTMCSVRAVAAALASQPAMPNGWKLEEKEDGSIMVLGPTSWCRVTGGKNCSILESTIFFDLLKAMLGSKLSVPDWAECERISDLLEVDEALLNFSNDSTGDNAVGVVQAVLTAYIRGDKI